MPTTVAFRFPWGRFHATAWGHHVNEGAVDWPPSPWRILRALYSAWRNRVPELPEPVVHRVLDALCEPPTYRLPERFVEAHSRHWLPEADFPKAGRAKAFDTCAVFHRDAELLVTWPVDLDAGDRAALAQLAERVPYLGRAESLCEARLLEGVPPSDGKPSAPVSAAGWTGPALISMLVPARPLDLAALTVRTATVRGAKLVDPPFTYRQPYPRAEPDEPAASVRRASVRRRARRPTAVRWAVTGPALPGVHAAVGLADLLRYACMAHYGRQNEQAASETFAGKDPDGSKLLRDHGHAHYLAFDADDDRLLDTLVLWAPGGLDAVELAAASAVDVLKDPRDRDPRQPPDRSGAEVPASGPTRGGSRGQDPGNGPGGTGGRRHGVDRDLRPVRVGLEAVGLVEDIAEELAEPSAVWRSVTPFAPPRHRHRRQATDEFLRAEVERELEFRGVPRPAAVEPIPGGWLTFRRRRVAQPLEADLRAFGLELRFDEPVRGPLALGALSHFGLGLFRPGGGARR